MKQRYDLPLKCQQLEVGDAAWLHNPQRKKGLSPKLQRPWQGPYTIIKRINDLVYRIQLGPKTKPKVVHRNRLWHYSGVNATRPLQLEKVPHPLPLDKAPHPLPLDKVPRLPWTDKTPHLLTLKTQLVYLMVSWR